MTQPVADLFSELYFAYGANMDPDEFTRRVGAMERIGPAYLENHRLVFNRHSTRWQGGVSSVVESPGQQAFGILWRITPQALAQLDVIENPTAYARVVKDVVVEGGHRMTCHLYVSHPQREMEPAPAYLALLINAAEKANLPPDHIAMLKAHRRRGAADL